MKRLLLFLYLLVANSAFTEERILNYHSDILVRADGWIEVSETIKVRAEGQQIKRGIYRAYPVEYVDKFGNNVKVLYEPKSVLRNGNIEDFHTETQGTRVLTYFGRADRTLGIGEHTYTYRYNAGRMLGYFEDRDEFYWNVTGNEWALPIDNASAAVTFDFTVPNDQLILLAYVGPFGATGGEGYTTSVDEAGAIRFNVSKALAANEGLTIVVAWPKGIIEAPSDIQRAIWLLIDNRNLLVAIAGLIAMFSYYIPVWRSYGKDPQSGVVLTLYEPPEGYSPASLRYIENMGYDNSVMTAAVVSLAVKGYIKIEVDDDTHTLFRLDPADDVAPMATGERELFDALFGSGRRLVLQDENYERVGDAKKAHEKSLKHDYHKRYFRTNGALNLPPLVVGILTSFVALGMGPSAGVFATIVLMAVTVIFFAIVMKRPTAPGRQIMDRSAGFREYLEIAEKDEMNLRNPPERTPALFERYLPFALALGVEQKWAERFAGIFASLKGPGNIEWQPSWYNGSWNNFDLRSSASSLSNGLGSAISSSVSPPGSSSGSSGGGFSGGGGGGGGGGGW